MAARYKFVTSCVKCTAADVPELESMIQHARPIKLATLRRHVRTADLAHIFFNYEWGTARGGLRLGDDYHVTYYRSRFRNRPCVYAVHSAIEYIFSPPS